MIERQELWCHACQRYVQFNLDMELDGNHILECPNCGHEHCRVVRDGKVTGDRWDSRNGSALYVMSASVTFSSTSVSDATTSGSTYLADSWLSSSTAAAY